MTYSQWRIDMWRILALGAALVTGTATLALAQGFDPDPANRGFGAYASPDGPHYYLGLPQGHGSASAASPRNTAAHGPKPADLTRSHHPAATSGHGES